MITLRIFKISILLTVFIACGRIENKAKQLGSRVKSRSTKFIDTTISQGLTDSKPGYFSITSIVTDFKNDKAIIEIRGIQTDNNFFYTEYCIYKGQKNRVLKGVNAIVPKKVNDYTSDDKCYIVNASTFYHDIAPYEMSNETAFFWNFEKLKSYEIYTCTKAPLRHYIIFDKSSDTVYHRIEEIRD